ncbi:hypothetical protein ACFFGH_09055 [Lysobacter korlensis]|uniref:Flagellar FliJ protein n=1 Tax=Lysobacter korlensis TaxID=553636 RepID=A0ABV6RLZ4_9GAMM
MSAESARRLGTLARWRTFQEAQAQLAHQQAAASDRLCAQAHHEAEAQARAVQSARAALLDELALDLARVEWAAAIESAAWQREATAAARRDDASAARDRACALHVSARTRLQVAESAQHRAEEQARRAQEMREFDQLGDLLAGGAR